MLTFTNLHPAAVGLWDTDKKFHVAAGTNGTVNLEPDTQSKELIDTYSKAGLGSYYEV